MQYYEVLPAALLPIDAIDECLNCVRVRWHRTEGNEWFSAGKEYGLVPIDAIRGRVHLVRADYAYPLLDPSVERRRIVAGLCHEQSWAETIFYVNRFYRSAGEEQTRYYKP